MSAPSTVSASANANASDKGPIPITIITGFLGSGKTTLILHLLPQLPPPSKYKLALLKNEFGDIAVDTLLTSSPSLAHVRELLNGCICCNLVGQLSESLIQLRDSYSPDRIIIETSGSAFPATLAMEVNRLAADQEKKRAEGGEKRGFTLDGVVLVVDVENWKGYEDTSYTSKIQARYTDLVVLNKWENNDKSIEERQIDAAIDHVRDLSDETPCVRSQRGKVPIDIIFGIDGGLARSLDSTSAGEEHHHHDAEGGHHSEVEVLSVTLSGWEGVKLRPFIKLLKEAPKDEIYRIKGLFYVDQPPESIQEQTAGSPGYERYIINWAFGRWSFTPVARIMKVDEKEEEHTAVRLTVVLARGEGKRWAKKLESGGWFVGDGGGTEGRLEVKRVS